MDDQDIYGGTTEVDGYDDMSTQSGNGAFRIILYVAAAVVAAAALYVAWLYVSSKRDWGYDIEWKFWKSSFLWPALSVIGFFLQFIDWQHTSFKEGWVVKDSWGREKFVENNDIMSTLFGQVVFPLIAHLFIIPCIYGAILYYLIIAPLALVNALIPYIAALVCIVLAVLFYLFARNFEWKSMAIFKLIVSTAFFLLLLWLISIPTSANFSFGKSGSSTESTVLPDAIGETTVTTKVANLRTGPGTSYDFYKRPDGTKVQAFMNDRLSVVEDQGDWYKVLTTDGGLAYIKKSLCTDMTPYSQAAVEDTDEVGNDAVEEMDCDATEDEYGGPDIGAEDDNQEEEFADTIPFDSAVDSIAV